MDIPLGGWLFLFADSRSNWSSEHWFSQRDKNRRKKILKQGQESTTNSNYM